MKPQDRTRAVLRSALTPTERLVLIAICDHMDHQDKSYPGVETLARETGFGRRTVLRSLSSLDGRGLIITKVKGRANRYTLDPSALPDQCHTGTRATESPVPQSHYRGATESLPPVPQSHGGGATESPEATMKRPSEATSEADAQALPPSTRKRTDSVVAIWVTQAAEHGWAFAASPSRPHVTQMAKVRAAQGAEGLRAAVSAYMDEVKAGTHWQRDSTPSSGVFVKELDKWASPRAKTSPLKAKVAGHIDRLSALVQAGSFKAASATMNEAEREELRRVLIAGTGTAQIWEAWPRVAQSNEWGLRQIQDKARKALGGAA